MRLTEIERSKEAAQTLGQAGSGGLTRNDALQAMSVVLRYFGQDLSSDSMSRTPQRFLDALSEMTEGYRQDPAEILSTTFQDVRYTGIVMLTSIEFVSLCEHHLLPFRGTADVAYLPSTGGRIVGLSKLARIVHCFAKRFQVQERMTSEIADAISTNLQTQGVAVVVRAHHSCMSSRGIRQPNGEMVTSELRGVFKTDGVIRQEFFSLLNQK